MSSTKHRMRSTKHRMSSTKHRMSSTKHRMSSTKHRMSSTKHRMSSTTSSRHLKSLRPQGLTGSRALSDWFSKHSLFFHQRSPAKPRHFKHEHDTFFCVCRTVLKNKGVTMIGGCSYKKVLSLPFPFDAIQYVAYGMCMGLLISLFFCFASWCLLCHAVRPPSLRIVVAFTLYFPPTWTKKHFPPTHVLSSHMDKEALSSHTCIFLPHGQRSSLSM
jgi:hypothetical protein